MPSHATGSFTAGVRIFVFLVGAKWYLMQLSQIPDDGRTVMWRTLLAPLGRR
jgi:hypothetical protein